MQAPDVQTSLTVLGRGGFADQPREVGDQVDLHEADLRKAHLVNASLVGAPLYGANLAGSTLIGVDLTDAYLVDANLAGAEIVACDFTHADLGFANLEKAKFIDTILTASLDQANLSGARLERAHDLEGAILEKAVTDADTTWPHAFDWVMAGAKLNGELPARFKWR